MSKVTLDGMFPGTTDRILEIPGTLEFDLVKWLISPPRDEFGKVIPFNKLTNQQE